MYNIMRVISLTLLLAIGISANAAEETKRMPFDVVGNGHKPKNGEKNKIYYYFLPDCPYCLSINELVDSWAATLPDEYELIYVPAVGNEDYSNVARAILAVNEINPKAKDKYIKRLFHEIQKRGGDTFGWGVYEASANKVGISSNEFYSTVKSAIVSARVKKIIKDMETFGVHGVPMFVIAGKYLTSLGHANGNPELLFQLLNGLVSEDYRSKGYRP